MSALDRNRDAVRAVGGFRLDQHNGKLMGVCAGVEASYGINRTLVRAGFVLGALISFGTAAIVYIAIGLIAD